MPPPPNSHGAADTGSTEHFTGPDAPCNDKQPAQHGIRAQACNGAVMKSTHTAMCHNAAKRLANAAQRQNQKDPANGGNISILR